MGYPIAPNGLNYCIKVLQRIHQTKSKLGDFEKIAVDQYKKTLLTSLNRIYY
jgi:hypothetical protein